MKPAPLSIFWPGVVRSPHAARPAGELSRSAAPTRRCRVRMTTRGETAEREAAEATETKGERTRRRLLELAIQRFGERGYRATSVSEIARAAGLTQAAAYAYFPSKEALFDASIDADAAAAIAEAAARAE